MALYLAHSDDREIISLILALSAGFASDTYQIVTPLIIFARRHSSTVFLSNVFGAQHLPADQPGRRIYHSVIFSALSEFSA